MRNYFVFGCFLKDYRASFDPTQGFVIQNIIALKGVYKTFKGRMQGLTKVGLSFVQCKDLYFKGAMLDSLGNTDFLSYFLKGLVLFNRLLRDAII